MTRLAGSGTELADGRLALGVNLKKA